MAHTQGQGTAYQQQASRSPRFNVKRAIDLAISMLAICLTAPLLLVVACAIKLDSSGPVVFTQARRGLNGRQFRIFKFRTMTVLQDGPIVDQAREGDPRVTKVGFWLRRSSIDELPQLVNVLRGEMSLVGPRPHAVAHDEFYSRVIEEYVIRQRVKPGLTGWAQVNGARGPTPELSHMADRIRLDAWYVKNQSLALDLSILVKTLLGGAWSNNAL